MRNRIAALCFAAWGAAIHMQQAAAVVVPERQPDRFTWQYNYEPEPGLRVWVRDGNTWYETFPSGKGRTFQVLSTVIVEGTRGTLTQASDEATFKVFIPDRGSQQMWLRFRRDDSQVWKVLGVMQQVE